MPVALTWLVWSQYCSLDLFLMRGSSSLYTMCSPMVVKTERPNPMHSSTKSPEKCLMPICKVCGRTGKERPWMWCSIWSHDCSLLDAGSFLLDPRKAGDCSSACSADITKLHCEGNPSRTEGCCRAQSWGATHIQSYCMNGFWSCAEALHLDYPMVSRETQRDKTLRETENWNNLIYQNIK